MNEHSKELLAELLSQETIYPWNPLAPETNVYLNQIEQKSSILDRLDDQEIQLKTNNLFASFHGCWSNYDVSKLEQSLSNRFGQFVPRVWLERLIDQARDIISDNLSPLEQLVECVKPLLSDWSEDDLQVMARPLAYSMRGHNLVKQASWEELSEVEKVKLTLMIAQYALEQLQTEQNVEESEG